jgi:RimJ/RimL family protein N-acetyltransferase
MKIEDLQEKDLNDIIEWFDTNIFRFFRKPINVEQLRILLPLTENSRPIRIAKKVVDENSTKVVGFVSSTIDWDNNMMHIRTLCTRSDCRHKGIGLFLMKEILKICFDDLKLHRAQLFVDEWNDVAVSFYEKLKFHKDGLMREAVKIGDQYKGWYCMSMLASEWERRGN